MEPAHREPLARAELAPSFLSADGSAFFAPDGRLTDAAVQTFIAHGIVTFRPNVPGALHAELVQRLAERPVGDVGSNEDIFQGHGKRFAEALEPQTEACVDQVLSSSFVRGAIESLCGPGAVRSPFKGVVR